MDGEQPSASLTVDEPPVPETVRAVVVMPAYNAASTLARTVSDLPAAGIAELILVGQLVAHRAHHPLELGGGDDAIGVLVCAAEFFFR